ncbi:IS110 family transposase [Amycolatopsis sp. cg5]|uniref:IS110 family transposase n=1 Tax=Amycolatopsis sp. cg5 TaxID=3238802 RepID=UPI0035234A42
MSMVVIGIDPHKSSHTAVAVDHNGRKLAQKTVKTDAGGILALWRWAAALASAQVLWAVEDGRGLAGRLVRTLIGHGAEVVWVPPKLMAQCRASARTRGKSDPIDALAVARAALREPDLPTAHLDQTALDLRLLTDRRESLVTRRTAVINALRWHLHDLDPALDTGTAKLTGPRTLATLTTALHALPDSVRRHLALDLVAEISALNKHIGRYERHLADLITPIAPTLLAIVGVSTVTAAKIIGETAGISRFRSSAAFAMHAGTAPIPVWSSGKTQFRLNRGGNRQLNTCLHRIAITQLAHHPPARDYRDRWTTTRPHATTKAALRALKRHLTNTIYRAMTTDATLQQDQLNQAA